MKKTVSYTRECEAFLLKQGAYKGDRCLRQSPPKEIQYMGGSAHFAETEHWACLELKQVSKEMTKAYKRNCFYRLNDEFSSPFDICIGWCHCKVFHVHEGSCTLGWISMMFPAFCGFMNTFSAPLTWGSHLEPLTGLGLRTSVQALSPMHLFPFYFLDCDSMFSTPDAKCHTHSEQINIHDATRALRVPADVAGSVYQSSEWCLF